MSRSSILFFIILLFVSSGISFDDFDGNQVKQVWLFFFFLMYLLYEVFFFGLIIKSEVRPGQLNKSMMNWEVN